MLDAADAVMGGLDLVQRELVVGNELGSVPESAPQVPLARDVAKAQKSARLRPTAEATVVEVDLRTPTGLRKSHLLHRLVALGVPWGSVVEGRGSSGTFRETWELQWDPELSVRLIEQAGYGTTLESAATARLLERATASSGIVELVGIITAALFADLKYAVEPTVHDSPAGPPPIPTSAGSSTRCRHWPERCATATSAPLMPARSARSSTAS